MIKLYAPKDEVELAVLRSLFEVEEIPVFVHNDHYGSLKAGIQIPLLNRKTLMVPKAFESEGKALVDRFLSIEKRAQEKALPRCKTVSIWDKLRMLLEFLLFGWMMPGERFPKRRG